MDIQVYLWVGGEGFSPQAFQRKLDPSLQGTIEHRKRRREDGDVEQYGEHWKSPVVDVDDHIEAVDRLYELFRQLRPALLAIRSSTTVVRGEIVSFFHYGSEVHGFYLSPEMIALLSEIGASLDIDQYYHGKDASCGYSRCLS